MLLDPLNLIGFGSGGAAARAAVAGAKGLTKSQLMRKGITAGAIGGAKGEAVAGGIAEGIADIGIQHRNIEIGLQDEFSYGRLLGSTAFGAVTGGGAGAAFGAAGAALPVRNLKFGALNFDDSRTMGDRSGPINKQRLSSYSRGYVWRKPRGNRKRDGHQRRSSKLTSIYWSRSN